MDKFESNNEKTILLKEPNNLKEISYPKEGAFWEKLLENDFHKKKFFAESFSKTKVLDCRTLLPKKINEINIEKNLYTYDNSFNRNSINYFNFHEYKNITFFLTGFKHLDKELVEDAILLNSLFSMLKINFRSHPDTNLKIIDKIKRLEKNFFLNNSWDKSDIFFGSIYSSFIYFLSKDTKMPGFIKVNLDFEENNNCEVVYLAQVNISHGFQ